jgi:hypothetical protein
MLYTITDVSIRSGSSGSIDQLQFILGLVWYQIRMWGLYIYRVAMDGSSLGLCRSMFPDPSYIFVSDHDEEDTSSQPQSGPLLYSFEMGSDYYGVQLYCEMGVSHHTHCGNDKILLR